MEREFLRMMVTVIDCVIALQKNADEAYLCVDLGTHKARCLELLKAGLQCGVHDEESRQCTLRYGHEGECLFLDEPKHPDTMAVEAELDTRLARANQAYEHTPVVLTNVVDLVHTAFLALAKGRESYEEVYRQECYVLKYIRDLEERCGEQASLSTRTLNQSISPGRCETWRHVGVETTGKQCVLSKNHTGPHDFELI